MQTPAPEPTTATTLPLIVRSKPQHPREIARAARQFGLARKGGPLTAAVRRDLAAFAAEQPSGPTLAAL